MLLILNNRFQFLCLFYIIIDIYVATSNRSREICLAPDRDIIILYLNNIFQIVFLCVWFNFHLIRSINDENIVIDIRKTFKERGAFRLCIRSDKRFAKMLYCTCKLYTCNKEFWQTRKYLLELSRRVL